MPAGNGTRGAGATDGEQIAEAAGFDLEYEFPRVLRPLATYLPQREGLRDLPQILCRLADKRSGRNEYYVSEERGDGTLAKMCLRQHRSGADQMSPFALRHGLWHLHTAGQEGEFLVLKDDPAFRRARFRAGLRSVFIYSSKSDIDLAARLAEDLRVAGFNVADFNSRATLERLTEMEVAASLLIQGATALPEGDWRAKMDIAVSVGHILLTIHAGPGWSTKLRHFGETLSLMFNLIAVPILAEDSLLAPQASDQPHWLDLCGWRESEEKYRIQVGQLIASLRGD